MHVAYHKETCLRTCGSLINPLNGQDLWPKTGFEPLLHPKLKRPTGRPTKNRTRDTDEPRDPHKLQRKCTSLKCSKCGNYGHNQRTCKGPINTKKAGKRQGTSSDGKATKVRKEAKWTFMGFKTAGEGSCVAGSSSIPSKRQQNVIPSQSSIAMGSQCEVGMRSSQHH